MRMGKDQPAGLRLGELFSASRPLQMRPEDGHIPNAVRHLRVMGAPRTRCHRERGMFCMKVLNSEPVLLHGVHVAEANPGG